MLQELKLKVQNPTQHDHITTSFAAGWSSPVARQAHNLKVTGSNPVPAPKIKNGLLREAIFVCASDSAAQMAVPAGSGSRQGGRADDRSPRPSASRRTPSVEPPRPPWFVLGRRRRRFAAARFRCSASRWAGIICSSAMKFGFGPRGVAAAASHSRLHRIADSRPPAEAVRRSDPRRSVPKNRSSRHPAVASPSAIAEAMASDGASGAQTASTPSRNPGRRPPDRRCGMRSKVCAQGRRRRFSSAPPAKEMPSRSRRIRAAGHGGASRIRFPPSRDDRQRGRSGDSAAAARRQAGKRLLPASTPGGGAEGPGRATPRCSRSRRWSGRRPRPEMREGRQSPSRSDRDSTGEGLSPRRHTPISAPRSETRSRPQGRDRKALAFFGRLR
jgi:hypothetical protein